MPYTPRLLNVLRVEDDAIRHLPEDLCVKDLGRIGRWADFVLGLAGNSLRAMTPSGEEEVLDHPDFITIDHRFESDSSVPRRDETHKLEGVEWSHKLKMPNTGILIGATLQARYANQDVPTIALPHSGVPGDFAEDLSTVLLLAQMQAETIEWDRNHLVAQACDTAQRLPRLAQDAIRGSADNDLRKGIESYRQVLLRRLGVPQRELGEPLDEGPRLMIDAVELTHLLAELDNASDEADLNARLGRVGLTFWSRDGREDCLDLRSLFLDYTRYDSKARRHLLPLRCTQADGDVRRYLERIHQVATPEFTKAAEFVLHNSNPDNQPRTFDNQPPHSWKLLALVFATAEAWMAKARRIDLQADLLDAPWDPWDDAPSSDEGSPSLRDYLNELLSLFSDILRTTGDVGPWSVSSGPVSIIGVHLSLRDAQKISRPALDRLLAQSRREELQDAFDNLVGKLVLLGAARQYGEPGNFCYRHRRTRLPERSTWPRRASITLSHKEVAWFLGYRDSEDVYNPMLRAARYGGYLVDTAGFVGRLLCGHAPRHLAVASHRYLLEYRSELDNYLGTQFIPDCPEWASPR